MRKYGKEIVVILVGVSIALSGRAFALEVGGIDFSRFGDLRQAEAQAGGADRSGFEPPPPPIDADNDGLISQDEFPGPDTHFYELDLDRDGFIDQGEAPTGPPPHSGAPSDRGPGFGGQ